MRRDRLTSCAACNAADVNYEVMKPIVLLALSLACSGRNSPPPPPVTPPKATKPGSNAKPRIEVCFVLDTTGSMSGLIEGAKQKIWSIANEMVSAKPTPELRFGLVAYRDRGDEYVLKTFDLTNDIDADLCESRGFQAAGGGDDAGIRERGACTRP